jgi:diguanylate cyclase (GGDEF)-like protein
VIVLGTDGAGRDGGRVDRRGRWLVRVATAGLAVVLLGLTGAAVLTAASVDDAVQRLQRISGERDAWVEVRYQVAQEHSIGHAYLARPNPKLRPALEKARTALGVALGHLVVNGEPEDVAEARRVQARHAPNLVLMGQMLDLVDASDTDAANDLHADRVHPAYIDLQNETAPLADREQAEATASMTLLRHRQHALLPAALVAGLVGMLALGGFLLLALGYQRQLVRQAAASHHQALHDPLTGLPNRELFADRVGQALRAADRELRPAALLLLDLDRFKDVNDTLGHHHGDRLLTEVAGRVAGVLRRVDTVARLGGDEFAVLLPDATAEGAVGMAEKLRAALHQPLTRWVLEAALRQAAEWHRAGHHLSVAVNVSTRSLLDASFPEQVAGRPGPLGGPGRLAGARGHRERRHGRPGARPRRARPPARPRGGPGGRRLRHRLLLDVVPEGPAGGRAQGRPLLRRPDGDQQQRRGDRAVHHRPRPQPRPARGRRGGGEPRTPGRS